MKPENIYKHTYLTQWLPNNWWQDKENNCIYTSDQGQVIHVHPELKHPSKAYLLYWEDIRAKEAVTRHKTPMTRAGIRQLISETSYDNLQNEN